MANRSLDPARAEDRWTIIRHPTRLTVARLCRRERLTIAQLANQMGTEDGALRGTVKQMVTWGVLLVDPSSTHRRRAYLFSPSWEKDLAKAVRHYRPLDLLKGQRVVLVDASRPGKIPLGDVAWIAEFDGERSLLAIADDAPTVAFALRDELAEQGLHSSSVVVDAVWVPASDRRDSVEPSANADPADPTKGT